MSSNTKRRVSGKVTQKMIAEYAGVSVPTVSLALSGHPRVNERTRLQIVRAGEELGYLPPGSADEADGAAAAAAGGGERGVQAPVLRQVGMLFIGERVSFQTNMELLQLLATVATEQGVRLELHAFEPPTDAAGLEELMERLDEVTANLDGVLLTSQISVSLIGHLQGRGVPLVVLGHMKAQPGEEALAESLTTVGYDDQAMGRIATLSLLRRSEGPVAFVSPRRGLGQYFQRWLEGYHLAHLDAGRPVDLSLVRVVNEGQPALETVQHFMALPVPPTGWVMPDQALARGVLDLMAGLGRATPRADVVLGGTPTIAAGMGFTGYPILAPDIELLCRSALRHLAQQVRGPRNGCEKVHTPFRWYNAPGPAGAGGAAGGAGSAGAV